MSNITEQQVQTLFDIMMRCNDGATKEVALATEGMAWIEAHDEFLEQFNKRLKQESERLFIGVLILAASGFIQLKETN